MFSYQTAMELVSRLFQDGEILGQPSFAEITLKSHQDTLLAVTRASNIIPLPLSSHKPFHQPPRLTAEELSVPVRPPVHCLIKAFSGSWWEEPHQSVVLDWLFH